MTADLSTVDAARRDVGLFAELLLGAPLWPHQLEVVRSPARYRVICAGRQVGKSRLLAVLSLHQAFSRAGSLTLLVSAGDVASRRLLSDVAALAQAPLLAGSVVDELSQRVVLTNGSSIRSVPASSSQIRGWPVDQLVVDEAAFIDPEIWRSAEPSIIARPGSRIVLSSSPWGPADHFFRVLWNRGMTSPDEQVASWHWPSSISPLVDQELLEQIREREPAAYFEREFLALWTDSSGAYFSTSEIESAIGDYELIDPDVDPVGAQRVGGVSGGIDWGGRRDAHALCIVAAWPELDAKGRRIYWVPWLEERFALGFDEWIDRLVSVGAAYNFQAMISEENGVGQMPSSVLARAFYSVGRAGVVEGVTTTSRLKQDGFGFIKLLMAQRRLRLPRRHVELPKQLRSLEYEMLDSGLLRIAVPPNRGHDDLAMAFMLSVLPLMSGEFEPEVVETITMEDLFPELADFQISPY
jgi:Terminase large subunit, T4likevirus-type, N-terminal/Terminase RNaseH-like domain